MNRSDQLDAQTRITSVKEIALSERTGAACLVQLRGPDLGSRVPIEFASITIGRDPTSDIILESDSVSRRHVRIDPSDDGGHVVRDNSSTNGTYLNEKLIRTATVLRSGDYIQVGEVIFKYLSGDNIELDYHEEIYRLTIEDGLTQIANKRALGDFLDKEFARAMRYRRDLAVLIFDIDYFKRINDEYGHLMGDFVLRELAKVVKGRVRREEMFARYGGEEFCIVLPELDLDHALEFAETIRSTVEAHEFTFEGNVVRVTISIGVAQTSEDMSRPEALILAADERLYAAKHAGRNRVVGA